MNEILCLGKNVFCATNEILNHFIYYLYNNTAIERVPRLSIFMYIEFDNVDKIA